METIGNFFYNLSHVLGRGSFGTVWRGHHCDDPQFEVAIKLLHLQSGVELDHSAQAKEDFLREARTLRRLQHPGIVRLYDFSWNDGRPYLVMELLSGGSLRDRLKAGLRLPVSEALALTIQLANALEVAHGNGVVHRDMKPDNIMLRGPDLTPVISDFGIARIDELTRLTSTQVGTPVYMAPEQFLGTAISGRTDVYALGIILHELLTSHVPYVSNSLYDLAQMHLGQPLPQLPGELASLQWVTDRMLAKEPNSRFPSAAAVAEALHRITTTDARRSEHEQESRQVRELLDQGRAHFSGVGAAQSDTQAVHWWRLAADRGSATAQASLGFMAKQGRGVLRSDDEAIRWFRLAADKGNVYGQFSLGVMYENGRGVAPSDVEATKWYRLAADQGYAAAREALKRLVRDDG